MNHSQLNTDERTAKDPEGLRSFSPDPSPLSRRQLIRAAAGSALALAGSSVGAHTPSPADEPAPAIPAAAAEPQRQYAPWVELIRPYLEAAVNLGFDYRERLDVEGAPTARDVDRLEQASGVEIRVMYDKEGRYPAVFWSRTADGHMLIYVPRADPHRDEHLPRLEAIGHYLCVPADARLAELAEEAAVRHGGQDSPYYYRTRMACAISKSFAVGFVGREDLRSYLTREKGGAE